MKDSQGACPARITWPTKSWSATERVREFIYVDAHTGKFIDRISGTPDALDRRAYDGQNLTGVPPSYPGSPFWVEGRRFRPASPRPTT